jgi:SAM-dependent methyltransferase
MSEHSWNDEYTSGEPLPWDTGEPDRNLVEAWRRQPLGGARVLDVGSGTGTNAIWLAQQGADVTGVDISAAAVERAQKRAGRLCRFVAGDFLRDELPGGPFDFVFDRGCFHVFDAATDRATFAAHVARILAPGGRWLSLVGSTEGAPREMGPPRRTAREVLDAIEPSLRLIELRASTFALEGDGEPYAWVCLSARRDVLAQPSTAPSPG